jgi:DNA-binding response OmpR family regulator
MATKIFLVEDNVTTRELLNTILSFEGFAVVAEAYSDSVEAVLNRIREERPQLVLMDFHIGPFNGLDLLSKVRQDAELHILPIIISSGADVFEECRKAGADSFVMKPYSIDHLMRAIREVLPKEQDPR